MSAPRLLDSYRTGSMYKQVSLSAPGKSEKETAPESHILASLTLNSIIHHTYDQTQAQKLQASDSSGRPMAIFPSSMRKLNKIIFLEAGKPKLIARMTRNLASAEVLTSLVIKKLIKSCLLI